MPDKKKTTAVTLKDIADSLGLSKATVSLCINANPIVAEKTRIKVMLKVDELGYVYNRHAASLSTGETHTIGLAIHDINTAYFTLVCAGVEQMLSQQKRMSFLCNSNESVARQCQFIDALVEHNADGLVMSPAAGTTAASLKSIQKHQLPTVLITREIAGIEFDFVGNDERLATYLATSHLLELGHSKIAFFGGNYQSSVATLRRAGYIDAMHEFGLQQPEQCLVDCDNSACAGEALIAQHLQSNTSTTAIVAFSDQLGLGIISGLLALGMTPGKDISVIGCDNIEESNRAYAQLSTIHIQKEQIGLMAADFLQRRLKDPQLPVQRKIFKPTLIARSSTGPVPKIKN